MPIMLCVAYAFIKKRMQKMSCGCRNVKCIFPLLMHLFCLKMIYCLLNGKYLGLLCAVEKKTHEWRETCVVTNVFYSSTFYCDVFTYFLARSAGSVKTGTFWALYKVESGFVLKNVLEFRVFLPKNFLMQSLPK